MQQQTNLLRDLESPQTPETATNQPSADSGSPVAALKEAFPHLPESALKIRAVQQVLVGNPPGFRVPPGYFYPDLKPLQTHMPELLKGGLRIYKAESTGDAVFHNPVLLPTEELKAIDAAGKLDQYIPEYGQMTGQLPTELSDEEAMKEFADSEDTHRRIVAAGMVPTGSAGGSQTPQPSAPPAPAAVQNRIAASRSAALQPGAPSSGPAPGGGRILNGLLKTAV